VRRGKKTKAAPSTAEITNMKVELLTQVDTDTDELDYIKELINNHEWLKEAAAKFPHFHVMMLEVRKNKIRSYYFAIFTCSSVKIDSETLLVELTEKEAKALGQNFASSLQGNNFPNNAVDEWVNAHAQLKELEIECPWFRNLMNEMASELLSTSSWGLVYRVGSSVLVGWADLGTDVITIYEYYENGQKDDALALLTMCGLNMLSN